LKRWWKALSPSNLLLMRTALSRALTEPSTNPILLNLKHCFIGHFVVVYCLGLLLCVLLLVWYCIIYIWSCLQACLVWKFTAIWFGARPRLAQRPLSNMFRLLLPYAAVWAVIRQVTFNLQPLSPRKMGNDSFYTMNYQWSWVQSKAEQNRARRLLHPMYTFTISGKFLLYSEWTRSSVEAHIQWCHAWHSFKSTIFFARLADAFSVHFGSGYRSAMTKHWPLDSPIGPTQPILTDRFSLGHTRAQLEVQLEMLSIPHMTRMNFDPTPFCARLACSWLNQLHVAKRRRVFG
jgi:hypothetical protein